MRTVILIACLLVCSYSYGTQADSIPILLLDTEIQIEATEGINSMYNFDFRRADSQFRWLKNKYGWHPLPYFLLGLSQWWRIIPNIDNKAYDDDFIAYMDSSIMVAQRIFDKGSTVEGGFFLSAAHAFKGRLYAERSAWTKAASEGKDAMNYLEYCRDHEEFGPEIKFGDALYNYYSVWIPEHYPILKPVMVFFRDGDKELGLQQLRDVSNNAFFTRTEAQYFLMKIESGEDGIKEQGLFRSEYLHTTFPNNAYFHRYYARLLYTRGLLHQLEPICESILTKIDEGYQGYEANSGRYAAFFLGEYHERRHNYDAAKSYYQLAIKFGEEVGAEEMGYHLHSLLSLGEIELLEENKDSAKDYFKQVKKLASRSSAAYKRAKRNLKGLK